jgi:SAM-dependent methyltransferase
MRWPISGRRPASQANARRNTRATAARFERWAPARDALWAVLDRHVAAGGRVAVVGAGNGHDVPLARLAGRAACVDLIDLDARAARGARGRLQGDLRDRVAVVRQDVTEGIADELVRSALRGDLPAPLEAPPAPVGSGDYDVVIGDLLYSQLLYPALRDSTLQPERVGVVLARIDRPLVASVVRRLHASAPGGAVVHVHDPLGWWAGHPQRVTLEEILEAAASDTEAALTLVARGHGPSACDPRAIALELGCDPIETAFWRWPFQEGVDYLACATVIRPGDSPLH